MAAMNLGRTSALLAATISVALALTSACRQQTATAIANRTASTASPPTAQAYERGNGVPRDYVRAFELHAEDCREGRGDLEACDAVIEAIEFARGTTYEPLTVLSTLKSFCAQSDDDVICVRAWILEAFQTWRDPKASPSPEEKARTRALQAAAARLATECDAGTGRACDVLGEFDLSADESTKYRRNEIACRAGNTGRCSTLIAELWGCEDWSAEGTCALIIADWQSNPDAQELLAVYERLLAKCNAGDADACEGLPGRALSSATLCSAHDYAACSALACLGDDAARELARRHGALQLGACHLAYGRALRAWDRSDRDEPPPIAADPMDPIGAWHPQPFEAILFRAHGGRDAQGWPRLDVHNVSDQDVVELTLCVVSFDADGHELARVRLTLDAPRIPSSGSVQIDLARHARVPRLGRASDREVVTYDRIRFASGPAIEDPARCPPSPWSHRGP
jgi:hypothetical protein